MKSTILQYLAKFPIFLNVRKEEADFGVQAYLRDFVLESGEYCSLLVFYTDTKIFGNRVLAIGNSDSIEDPYLSIASGLRVFKDKASYQEGRWDFQKYNECGNYLHYLLTEEFAPLVGVKFCRFCVHSVKVVLRPMAYLLINYSYKGVLQKPLTILIDGKVVLSNPYEGDVKQQFKGFIEDLCIDELFVWED